MKRELARRARAAGGFDARRYFRGDVGLRFYNVKSPVVRDLARAIHRAHGDGWPLSRALQLADRLIEDPYLETKGVGIEVVALYRRRFVPACLPVWKRWLARGHASNWATTDAICGSLIGPLLLAYPALVRAVAGWSRHPGMWVRRASAVGLIPSVRRGRALEAAYAVARRLHRDREDLIQKAVGWLLREAGRTDPARLERYLRAQVRSIPRTTFRYAIERFTPRRRRRLLSLPGPVR